MLTIAKERIQEINQNADVHLFGQEVNPETFSVCKSDLFMKSADGRDAENIMFGSGRFAEVLFVSVARIMGLPWNASSRGLALERGVNNIPHVTRSQGSRRRQSRHIENPA
jgi:hypothetical protein